MLPLPGPPLLAPRSFPLSGIDRSVFKHRLENHRLSLFRRDREGRARRNGSGDIQRDGGSDGDRTGGTAPAYLDKPESLCLCNEHMCSWTRVLVEFN